MSIIKLANDVLNNAKKNGLYEIEEDNFFYKLKSGEDDPNLPLYNKENPLNSKVKYRYEDDDQVILNYTPDDAYGDLPLSIRGRFNKKTGEYEPFELQEYGEDLLTDFDRKEIKNDTIKGAIAGSALLGTVGAAPSLAYNDLTNKKRKLLTKGGVMGALGGSLAGGAAGALLGRGNKPQEFEERNRRKYQNLANNMSEHEDLHQSYFEPFVSDREKENILKQVDDPNSFEANYFSY